MCKIFSLVPSKKVCTFQFLNNKIGPKHQFCQIAKCRAKWLFFGITVNSSFQKLKRKQFSWMTGFFEGIRENILHIFLAS
jgi:hypothetical protein